MFSDKDYQEKYRKNHREEHKIYSKKYYQIHKEERKIEDKEYRRKHKEEHKIYSKKYYQNNKEKIKMKEKEYRKNNIEKIRIRKRTYRNIKLNIDPNFKLRCNLRGRLNKAIRGNFKSGSAVRDLGCSIPEFKKYIESKFQPGMSWENWSFKGWHIDHIIPLNSFNLTDRVELLKAVNYKNLQPMWGEENINKSDKILKEEFFR